MAPAMVLLAIETRAWEAAASAKDTHVMAVLVAEAAAQEAPTA
jgi:hypothetical protein